VRRLFSASAVSQSPSRRATPSVRWALERLGSASSAGGVSSGARQKIGLAFGSRCNQVKISLGKRGSGFGVGGVGLDRALEVQSRLLERSNSGLSSQQSCSFAIEIGRGEMRCAHIVRPVERHRVEQSPVAAFGQRLDIAGLARRVSQSLAKLIERRLDRVVADKATAPNGFEDFIPCDNPSGAGAEKDEQIHLQRFQSSGPLPRSERTVLWFDRPLSEFEALPQTLNGIHSPVFYRTFLMSYP